MTPRASGRPTQAETPTAPSPHPTLHSPRPQATSGMLPRRPYPGLRPFEQAEWPVFRGRDRLIQDVLTILAANHFVSVIGTSGCGKSSLVKAGVIATLERRHGRMGVRWRTGTMRPGASPVWSMADGILRSLRPDMVAPDGELPADEVARLRVLIDTSEDWGTLLTRDFGLAENENFLLLADQFEEIFRYRSPEEDRERARFIELLLPVARTKPPGLYVVVTMRSEYLGECARFAGLAETLNETHYLLPRMTTDELRQAIVEPARLKKGHIEDELVERLISDLRAEEDQLPILQHTLLWMWIQEEERRQREGLDSDGGIRLGLAEYEQLTAGRNGSNALSRHGNRILAELSSEGRKVAEIMFRRMVEVEGRTTRLRRPTRCGTVRRLAAQDSLDLVQHVVDAFRAEDASFIRVNPGPVTDDTSIDIMHESLIRQWDTLDRWVREEKASYEVYSDLCRAAQGMEEGRRGVLSGLDLSRALLWASREQPTRLWARRYGGDLDAGIRFLMESEQAEEQQRHEQKAAEEAALRQEEERLRLENEQLRLEEEQSRLRAEKSQLEREALRTRLEEQTKLASERRRFTRLATAAAVGFGVLAAVAGWGFWEARQAAIETSAGKYWYRLQLWVDPLRREDVVTLWDLNQEDEEVRVAFVRQMTEDHELLRRFGFRPQPIARAVGLRWPDEAREIAKQSLVHVASDEYRFDPNDRDDLFELITYTRALVVLQHWLDPVTADAAAGNLADAINDLAREMELSDRQLWMLAETAGVFSERLDPAAIEPARDRLRQEITTAASGDASGRRGRGISRAIEVMARDLGKDERRQAVGYMAPQLGQDLDSWSATAVPRAASALLPVLDAGEANPIVRALPPAIASAAVAQGDSSYLLALMQVVETLGGMKDGIVADFGRALVTQLAVPNDPLQRAALARATVPLLDRLDEAFLNPIAAEIALIPEGRVLDPAQRSHFRSKALKDAALLNAIVAEITLVPEGHVLDPGRNSEALEEANAAFEQAFAFPDESKERQSVAALDILHKDWSTAAPPTARPNPYRRAAQARLAALLAPSLQEPAPLATDLLDMLPRAQDYLVREAIARALAALGPKLPHKERAQALVAAKVALAKTGSTEEATVWAQAIVALLPDEPRAATAEIVEALKSPTAASAPSDVLLAGLATFWKDYEAIAGRTLPDPVVLDWLADHLRDGSSLIAPPPRPPGLELDEPGPGAG